MPIYQNIDGAWRRIVEPAPQVYDTAAGGWVPVEAVFTHAQGKWRQIWPDTVVEGVMITVNAVGATWPDSGYVEVTIEQVAQPKGSPIDVASPMGAPKQGTVVVTTGDDWRQEFPASWGRQAWPLPPRNAGTYVVEAVWSQDPDVTGSCDYTITRAEVTVTLSGTTSPAEVKIGSPYVLHADVTFQGNSAPEGGYTMVRHQDVPNGPMDEWSGARIYTGGTVPRVVVPNSTVQWSTLR